MPRVLRFGILALMALAFQPASMVAQDRELFVEVGPGASPFFTGDVIVIVLNKTHCSGMAHAGNFASTLFPT
jgi:hypothetical protein